MDDSEDLPLRDGILRWCDASLVAAAVQADQRVAAIRPPPHPPSWLGGARRADIENWHDARSHEQRIRAAAAAAWRVLLDDLRRRLVAGELVVSGVQAKPARETERQALPGVWAPDFHFEPETGAIAFDDRRFIAVRIAPRGVSDPKPPSPTSGAALNVDDLDSLDDATILRLLHINADRAATTADGQLFPPGKMSLIAIIKRRMIHRAEQGELCSRLVDEAGVLAAWIKQAIPHRQTPTSKTIQNSLRSTYAALKAQSTGPIQKG